MSKSVKVWEEDINIPTYEAGKPEKSPMFLEKRVYQGSSGVVYPYPVIEKISDTCTDKMYHAIFLENEYIKVMILPELGGRVQMAYDKIKQRHFIYYNHVIKPALVGLAGPWISGGIEFNWPQHHRPSTFMPVDYTIERKDDGSAIVWVNERERMFHQKGMAGFILRPGRAVLEIQGRLSNPTPIPQTFLWWANPAVAVNDHYQSVFPGDVHAVFDHGKRDVSRYPIATGTYYKMDYSAGVDISRYKNIPVPTSYMAVNSKYNFVGGYENDTRAGVLHVANHHISPGKKQWTWGNGDFGQAWDRNLTDSDGPYIELMTGVYTDNQPDFTWLQPYEEKTFTQYFLPYRELGVVKNASADLLMNLEDNDGATILKLFATRYLPNVCISILQNDREVWHNITTLSPENVYEQTVHVDDIKAVKVWIYNEEGHKILYWESESEGVKELPDRAKAAPNPEDVPTIEQLYLTGLHIEQYRHATYSATDYYQEALKRDPLDVRANNAMGLWMIRKGQFAKAEHYLRNAIKRLTERNPNPYDGEPSYNLGLSLKYQAKFDEAYEAFYKACWNGAWQDAGYFSLAQISTNRRDWDNALYEIDKSLLRNWHSMRARHLKTAILRLSGKTDEALLFAEDSLHIDAFNFGCLFEKYLLTNKQEVLDELQNIMRHDAHNYEELTIDYMSACLWDEAMQVSKIGISVVTDSTVMLLYYLAWCLLQKGENTMATQVIQEAESMPINGCFPNTPEAIIALQAIIRHKPNAAKALYYLGNIWYDKRQYDEAISAWETSIKIDDTFPTVLRNLALAYFNKLGRKEEAVSLLEKAYALDTSDARLLMELDQLYKHMNYNHSQRLDLLHQHQDIVCLRDDLYLEYATLLNHLGRYEEAIQWIDNRKFHPWEGGEGKVTAQYQMARLELAKQYIKEARYDEALTRINECYVYPHHLGEGKLRGAQENDFNYYKGCILEAMGRAEEANECWEAATKGNCQPTAAMYYYDQKPDKIFYQGLALLKLGRSDEAKGRFHALIDYGEKHLFDKFKMDYFAVSLPDLQIWEDDMDKKNVIHCNYLMGLGHLGLGDTTLARTFLDEAHRLDNNHQGVQVHKSMITTTINKNK